MIGNKFALHRASNNINENLELKGDQETHVIHPHLESPSTSHELINASTSSMFRRFSALNISGDNGSLQPSNIITNNEVNANYRSFPAPSPLIENSYLPDESNLFVGDLARNLTEEDLLAAFSQYGRVMTVNIKRDRNTGRNLGYGFIKMGSHEEAQRAKDRMQKAEIRGRKLRVGWAQKNTSLFVGGFLENITVEQLNAFFRPYGELDEESSSIIQSGRCGIVRFKNRANAENARRHLNGMEGLGSPTLKVDWHNSSVTGVASSKNASSRYGKDIVYPSGFCVHVILENPNGINLDSVEDTIHELFIEYSPLADVVVIKEEGHKDMAKENIQTHSSNSDTSLKSNADAGAGSNENKAGYFDKESTENSMQKVIVQRVHCSVRFAATVMGHTKAINSMNALNGSSTCNGDKVTCLPPKTDMRVGTHRPYSYPQIPTDMSQVPMAPTQQFNAAMWSHMSGSPAVPMRDPQRAPFDGNIADDVRKPNQNYEMPQPRTPNWPANANMYIRSSVSPYGLMPYGMQVPSSPSIAYSERGEITGCYAMPMNMMPYNHNEALMPVPNSPNFYQAQYINAGYYNGYAMGYPPRSPAYMNPSNYIVATKQTPEAQKYSHCSGQTEN